MPDTETVSPLTTEQQRRAEALREATRLLRSGPFGSPPQSEHAIDAIVPLAQFILGDEYADAYTCRVLRDGNGDTWFEVDPGRFVCASSWGEAMRRADNAISEEHIRDGVGATDITHDYIDPALSTGSAGWSVPSLDFVRGTLAGAGLSKPMANDVLEALAADGIALHQRGDRS